MFRLILPLALAFATPVQAQTIAERLSEDGLAATEAHLSSLADPTPDERFALGGVLFLGSVERALQLRYRHGIDPDFAFIPVLRLPIAENPSPEPFAPDVIDTMFAEISADMDRAVAVLDTIGDDDAVSVPVNLSDIWFDIDDDGARRDGEGLLAVLGEGFNLRIAADVAPPTIRFDTADAAWLSAYAHFVAAFSEAVQALSPEEAIAAILESTQAFAEINARTGSSGRGAYLFASFVDVAAITLTAIEQQPDPVHSRAVLAHMRAMIADNRVFWTRVAAETDDKGEWIPNDDQTAAIGLTFPPGTGAAWLDVLDELDLLLKGERLLPFWRLGDGAGLNLVRLLEDPPEIDIISIVQGRALLPYVEVGPVISPEELRRFDQLVQGESVVFAVVLN